MLFVPDTHFALPLSDDPISNPPNCIMTVHGLYPVYRHPISADTVRLTHFGLPLTICAPPLTPAALLCAHVRRQLGYVQPPHGLLARRSELAPGAQGATYEDYEDYNKGTLTRCAPRANVDEKMYYSFLEEEEGYRRCSVDDDIVMGAVVSATTMLSSGAEASPAPTSMTISQMFEHEWLRITHCYNPWLDAKIKVRVYTPGMLHGLWSGRFFVRFVSSSILNFLN